jgi:nuclease-like protein
VPSRVLSLRRPDVCCACGRSTPVGTRAYWNAEARTVTCLACLGVTPDPAPASLPPPPARPAELDRGRPGASAEREYQRRRHNRETRTRRRHPRIGGLLLAVGSQPQHETAFHRGGRGEAIVARSLERRTAKRDVILLHDRRMPGGYGNIDHLAIAPTGVYAIDAKDIKGKVRVERPWRGEPKLIVAGRSRRKLIDGLDRQVQAVQRTLAEIDRAEIPVHGVFCFTKADLPLFGRLQIRDHELHHCRAVARKLNRRGPLADEAIDVLARQLADAFPSA